MILHASLWKTLKKLIIQYLVKKVIALFKVDENMMKNSVKSFTNLPV